MRLSTGIKFALGVWLAAEILVFVLVAEEIGLPAALLVAFITSLFGWTLLKRTGASALSKLRALLDGRADDSGTSRFLDDGLATAGAVALLVPGFLSDVVGFALAVPAARSRLSRWIGVGGFQVFRPGGRPPQHGPTTIELAPDEWVRTDPSQRPATKV